MPRHAEKRVLPYSVEQMFDLVAAVERYPEFLPWCLGCRVIKREPAEIQADLLIGFKVFRERWHSRVLLGRPDTIDVQYIDGPFRHLENRWRFEPHVEGCLVDFYVDFEFRSRLLSRLMSGLFGEAVHRMVRAFETRARQVYGTTRPVAPAGVLGR
jgi:coenzyme Q-binding protein COQ10